MGMLATIQFRISRSAGRLSASPPLHELSQISHIPLYLIRMSWFFIGMI